jgi:hypothetical protein
MRSMVEGARSLRRVTAEPPPPRRFASRSPLPVPGRISGPQTCFLRTDQTKLSYQKWSSEQAMNGASRILKLFAVK